MIDTATRHTQASDNRNLDPSGDVELKICRTHSFKNEAVYGTTI